MDYFVIITKNFVIYKKELLKIIIHLGSQIC